MRSCLKSSIGSICKLIGKIREWTQITYFLFTLTPCSLNEAFSEAQRYQTQHFQIFAPKMPLNNSPLCVTLHVRNSLLKSVLFDFPNFHPQKQMKNFSDTEREWKIIKQLSCECLVRKNRLRKKGEPHLKCLHKDVIEMRPTIAKLLPGATALVDLTFEYNLPGPQETHFTILWVAFFIVLNSEKQSS